jgi:hypothetical protein
MSSFVVKRICQTLADDTPLHGKVGISIEGSTFVCTPAHGAMVDNNIPFAGIRILIPIHRIIFRLAFIPHT